MKRKAADSQVGSQAKRQREPEPDYCDVEIKKDGNGNVIWPAEREAMERAREFLREW